MPLIQATPASFQRVLGPTHPDTRRAAGLLEDAQAHRGGDRYHLLIRANPPTNTAARRPADVALTLPAGTRVLVQRLVAKPEHNGQLFLDNLPALRRRFRQTRQPQTQVELFDEIVAAMRGDCLKKGDELHAADLATILQKKKASNPTIATHRHVISAC
jgi:hypothetical protein